MGLKHVQVVNRTIYMIMLHTAT